jgi:L-lactate utilization protein LutB
MTYDTLPSEETIARVVAALKEHGVEAIVVNNREEALAKMKELIPAGASLDNGASRTLEEIGYIDYLKEGKHGWNNLKEAVVRETDPAKQSMLRKQALLSDYYAGSVHAIAETGEMMFASMSGSQLPHLVFTSPHLVLVAGTQKIVPTLDEAFKRVREYVLPLEDARMKSTGAAGSMIAKLLILMQEPSFMGRTIQLILVKEKLGF